MSDTVDVQDLRVGMFIHLDMGWMSHPFPLSSFKITTAEQITTLRGLGKQRLRWSPQQSDPPPEAASGSHAPASAESAEAAGHGLVLKRPVPAEPEPLPEGPSAEVARQREAVQRCERQHQEACQDLRRINDQVLVEPLRASAGASQLAEALLDKMLPDTDLCVRVLGEAQGDRASAHAMNVAVISMLLGRAMGLPRDELQDLGVGALLHDVGKLTMPDHLRLPADDFTIAESLQYQDHVAQGIVQGRRMALSPGALLVLAQHHEQADGSGFPRGLPLERMSGPARIVSIVNRYDNLCNARLQAKARTPHEALSLMFAQSRSKFDVAILNAFVRMMGVYPPGSVVQLSNDRYAMVMTVNPLRPLKPRVLVFDPAVPVEDAVHLDLETCPDVGIRRSLVRDQLPPPVVRYLAPRQRVIYFFDNGLPQDEAPPLHADLPQPRQATETMA